MSKGLSMEIRLERIGELLAKGVYLYSKNEGSVAKEKVVEERIGRTNNLTAGVYPDKCQKILQG